MPKGLLIVWYSEDGRTDWRMVLPQDVPAWLKEHHVMARLVAGEVACEPSSGDIGWYRVEKVFSDNETKQ